jgi:hypothetical protein
MPLSVDDVCETIDICNISHKHRTHQHIAVLYRRGKILAVATNAVGSRSRGCGYSDRTIHAERAVLKKLGDLTQLRGAELVVVRLTRSKDITNSEPCHSCKKHLTKCMREYGLRKVYYS